VAFGKIDIKSGNLRISVYENNNDLIILCLVIEGTNFQQNCFAKQSEQRITNPLLSLDKVSGNIP
jgi:hypothetical protein